MIAEHVEDDIAAYAFGALSDAERRRVEEHAAMCPACSGRIEEAQILAGLLPYSSPPHAAPQAIKAALFLQLESETADIPVAVSASDERNVATTGAGTIEPPPWALPDRRPRWERVLFRTIPWTLAMAGWLVAIVFIIYSHGQNDRLRTERQGAQAQLASIAGQLRSTQSQLDSALSVQAYLMTPRLQVVPLTYMAGVARHTSVSLIVGQHYAHALMVARGLAVLPQSTSYVVWAKASRTQYVRLGVLTTSGPRAEGATLLAAPAPIDGFRAVGLTIESGAAPNQPSTPLVFAATLNSGTRSAARSR